MFYTHAILAKRGPLARLWLAAHWDKKLTKAQIFETDIRLSCESILEPCLKLALRTKGHLLLGVVRIYSRKTKYLLADCNEAFVKIKMAFRPGIVGVEGTSNQNGNQDSENRELSIAAITLPDNFHDFDMIDLNLDFIENPSRFQVHQARTEEITLKEDCISEPTPMDDDFGDVNILDQPEFFRNLHASTRQNGSHSTIHVENNAEKDRSIATPFSNDPFGMDAFDDPVGPPSIICIGNDQTNMSNIKDHLDPVMSPFQQDDNVPVLNDPHARVTNPEAGNPMDIDAPMSEPPNMLPTDDTTLLSNVSDEYVLPPISTTAPTAATRQTLAKRRRKLVIDEVKEIDSSAMKMQLTDIKDIVGVLELAPPTRRLMFLKETGGIDKLFSTSASYIFSKALQQLITRNFITKPVEEMVPQCYQNQYDSLMEQREIQQDESSIEQMRAAHQDHFDLFAHDPSLNFSKKRALSPAVEQSFLDKRPRMDSMPPMNSLVFPPMTSMDNLMDFVPESVSPMRQSVRKIQELNRSPTEISNQSKSKKVNDTQNKENQEQQDDEYEQDEHGQTITAQEDFESGKQLNRRAKTMLKAFECGFKSADTVSFHDHLLSDNPNFQTRKSTAQKFFTLLVLKKLQAVDVKQNEAYGDITVMPGVHFQQYAADGPM